MYAIRSTSGCHSIAKLGKHDTDEEALSSVLALPCIENVRIVRLLYASRALSFGPDMIFALLEASAKFDNSWSNMLMADVELLHGIVASFYDLPHYNDRRMLTDWILAQPKK